MFFYNTDNTLLPFSLYLCNVYNKVPFVFYFALCHLDRLIILLQTMHGGKENKDPFFDKVLFFVQIIPIRVRQVEYKITRMFNARNINERKRYFPKVLDENLFSYMDPERIHRKNNIRRCQTLLHSWYKNSLQKLKQAERRDTRKNLYNIPLYQDSYR